MPLAFRELPSARAAVQEGGCNEFAIQQVTLLAMTPGAVPRPEMTVLIEGDRITAVEPADGFRVPEGCVTVDGRGKWLMPSLVDMHVHFLSESIPELDFAPEDILLPYVANGVLQIVDMAATPSTNAIRDAVARSEIVAPHIASAAMIDGSPTIRPGAREIARPDDVRAVIAAIAEEGFDFIKVYSRLDTDVFAAVLEAAEEFDLRVIGHFPGERKAQVEDLLRPGFALVAHAEEFAWLAPEKSDVEIARFTELALENGTAVVSTLYLDQQILAQVRDPGIIAATEGLEFVHPVELMLWFEQNPYLNNSTPERIAALEAVVDFNDRLVWAFVTAGVPVFAGTDASFIPGLAPGFALHEELAALVRAGLTPLQALDAATVKPTDWLGVGEDRGTIEVGKRANLLLLDADPLADIRNSRAIAGVIVEGNLFDRAALDTRLAELADLYAPVRPYFSPEAAEALET